MAPGVACEETIAAFLAVITRLGYESCDNEALEQGVEKVALFATPDGEPTHAARQLVNGRWTSKLRLLSKILNTSLHDGKLATFTGQSSPF